MSAEGVEERVLVIEQHLAVTHRDHVIVEHALIDHRRVLLGIDHAPVTQAVQAGHRLAGFQGLPRRVALRCREAAVESAAAKDKELHTRVAIIFAEARVVGRAFVTKLSNRRQGGVMSEVLAIVEHRRQHTAGGRVLD